ncbi:hypothetical protein RQP46_005659 [Phenoliferia psychrophenolica]
MEFQPIEGGPLRTAIAICVYYALWEEFDPGGIVRLPGTPSGDMIKELSERHTGKAVQTTTPVLFCIPNEPNKRTPYRLLVKHFAKPPGEQRTTELQQAKRMARQWMEGHVHASYQGAVSPEAIVIQHVVPPLPTPAANPLPPPNGVVAPVAAAAPSTSESYIDSITDALSPMIRDIATRLVMDSGIKRKGLATLSSPDVLRELAKELEMMCLQKIAAHAED